MTQGVFGVVAGVLGTGYFIIQFFRYLNAYHTQKLIQISFRSGGRMAIPSLFEVIFQLGLALGCIYIIYKAVLFIQKSNPEA